MKISGKSFRSSVYALVFTSALVGCGLFTPTPVTTTAVTQPVVAYVSDVELSDIKQATYLATTAVLFTTIPAADRANFGRQAFNLASQVHALSTGGHLDNYNVNTLATNLTSNSPVKYRAEILDLTLLLSNLVQAKIDSLKLSPAEQKAAGVEILGSVADGIIEATQPYAETDNLPAAK